MKISDLTPEQRTFHVDRECYIFYLGSDLEDERPLVRIGNSDHLDPRIIYNISSIVVTDSITGDPALEPRNVILKDIRNCRYVGDKKTIEDYFDFIRHVNIQDGKSTTLEGIRAAPDRAEAIFFKGGNLRLHYEQNVLFDLERNRRGDFHFPQLADWLKERMSVNPLRYQPADFHPCGVMRFGETFQLFADGKILSLELPPDYFPYFTMTGIDPDLVDTVVVDRVTSPLIQYLKRCRASGRKARLLTADPGVMKIAARLFQRRPDPISAQVAEFTRGMKKKIGGYTVAREQGEYLVRHRDLPAPLSLSFRGDPTRRDMTVLTSKGTLLPPGTGKSSALQVPDGVPILFHRGGPGEVLDRYLLDLIPLFQEAALPEESQVLDQVDRLFQDVKRGTATGSSVKALKKQLRTVRSSPENPLLYLLTNIRTVCRILGGQEDRAGEMREALEELGAQAGRVCSSAGRPAVHVPVIGDLYLGLEDGPAAVLLYRSVKESVYRDDFKLAMDFRTEVSSRIAGDRAFYSSERERLGRLMEELGIGAPAKEVREALKQQRDLTLSGVGRGELPEPPTVVPRTLGVSTPALKRKKREEERRERKRRRVAVPLAAAALLAVLAALAFLPIREGPDGERTGVFGRLSRRGAPPVGETTELVAREPAGEQAPDGIPAGERPGGVEPGEQEGREETEAGQAAPGEGAAETAEAGPATYLTESGMELPVFRGQIKVTVLDVYLLSNRIALRNGYHTLDRDEVEGKKDPDWIYPGNRIELPDGSVHVVEKGDTIWHIAGWFIHDSLEKDWPEYRRIERQAVSMEHTQANRSRWLESLRDIRERTYSENFHRMLDEKIEFLSAEP